MLITHKKFTHFNHLCLTLTSKKCFHSISISIYLHEVCMYLVTALNRKHCSPILEERTYSLYTEEKDLRELKRTVF